MTTESVTTKKISTLSKVSSLLTLLIAVMALLIGGRLFYMNSQHQDAIAALEGQLVQQQEKLAKLDAQQLKSVEQITALNQMMGEVNEQLNQNKQSDALRQYRLGNIEHFIRLANQVLLLEHDAPKAQRLLESANTEIVQLKDPLLHDVQEQIAKDIAALKAVPNVSVDELFTQLNALIEQAEKLPITPSLKFAPIDNSEQVVTPAPLTLSNMLNWLSQYIKIQKHDGVATPLLTPEEASFVKHNIVVLLEQAQWGVLRREAHAYKTSLERVEKLIAQYGEKDDAAVKAFLDSVAKLIIIDMSPSLPDVSTSLPLLEKITTSAQSDAP